MSNNKKITIRSILDLAGINVRDEFGNRRYIGDIIRDISFKWQEFTPEQQNIIAEKMAGERNKNEFYELLCEYNYNLRKCFVNL